MKEPLSNRLRNQVDLYGKIKIENELGEVDYDFAKIKSIWAEITPQTGRTVTVVGNVEYEEVTYKFVVRAGAIPKIENSMYFMFKGQRYDINYFNPNYKYRDTIEIICKLVME